MTVDEWNDYIFDPTGFYLHKCASAPGGAYETLGLLPDFAAFAGGI
jgi:hypothetical protein